MVDICLIYMVDIWIIYCAEIEEHRRSLQNVLPFPAFGKAVGCCGTLYFLEDPAVKTQQLLLILPGDMRKVVAKVHSLDNSGLVTGEPPVPETPQELRSHLAHLLNTKPWLLPLWIQDAPKL